MLYLQELAEELTSVYQPLAPNEGTQEPESDSSRKKRRSRRRKEEEADDDDDDPSQDVDFVPSEEVLLQAEEEESDLLLSEVSESEPEAVRGHSLRMPSAGVTAASLIWPLVTPSPGFNVCMRQSGGAGS